MKGAGHIAPTPQLESDPTVPPIVNPHALPGSVLRAILDGKLLPTEIFKCGGALDGSRFKLVTRRGPTRED